MIILQHITSIGNKSEIVITRASLPVTIGIVINEVVINGWHAAREHKGVQVISAAMQFSS
jgi:hypothetical protein